ncbi:MAG: thioredoxin [Thaumarchaeota archaeon]|nr:thioredoxin [Nitrososphaerota archaeon]
MQSSKGESNVKEITESNWKSEVLNSERPVLVDFWASWCGPCRMLAPVIEEIAKEKKFDIKVVKVNVDENQSLAASNGVQSIPTLRIFKKGQAVQSTVGVQSKAALEKLILNAIHA